MPTSPESSGWDGSTRPLSRSGWPPSLRTGLLPNKPPVGRTRSPRNPTDSRSSATPGGEPPGRWELLHTISGNGPSGLANRLHHSFLSRLLGGYSLPVSGGEEKVVVSPSFQGILQIVWQNTHSLNPCGWQSRCDSGALRPAPAGRRPEGWTDFAAPAEDHSGGRAGHPDRSRRSVYCRTWRLIGISPG